MTNRRNTHNQQNERPPLRRRGASLVRLWFMGFAIIFVLGCQQCDTEGRDSIGCATLIMFVEPGACVPMPNPCANDGRWVGRPTFDGFRLCPTPEQQQFFAANGNPISIETTTTDDGVTRSICVKADSPHFAHLEIPFIYGRVGRAAFGIGDLILSVGRPLAVTVRATPPNINIGESSQLTASASGGFPPYFYSWVPTTGLNDTDIAAPIARPVETTTYRCRVTDSAGREAFGSVTVSVGLALTVTANPPQINVGDASNLIATPVGGTPPYTFAWTPVETLDDPTRGDPIALPTTTTTYHVTASDSTGTTLHGSATVSVRLGLTVTANPLFINPGESSQLNSIAVGGSPPYSYSWTPADTLDRSQEPNPIATPVVTTTYRLLLSDSLGAQRAESVTVTVDGSPPPTASFFFTITATRLNLDASASTGNIVTYTWDLSWASANPDRITASPTTSFMIQEFNRGTITLTAPVVAQRRRHGPFLESAANRDRPSSSPAPPAAKPTAAKPTSGATELVCRALVT